MVEHVTEDLTVQGHRPTGMLRICHGSQERYIWPVHLPGWLELGWRVASAAEALPQPVDPEASAATPQAGKGQRNRRRKEADDAGPAVGEEPTGAAAVEPSMETSEAQPDMAALPDRLLDDGLT